MNEWSTFLEDLSTQQLCLLTEALIVAMDIDSANAELTDSRLSACRDEILERSTMHEGGLGINLELLFGISSDG